MPGNRGEFGLSLGTLFKRRLKRVFLPGFFFGGRYSIRRRALRGRGGLRGAFGSFAHAHRPQQGFEKSNRNITKINAMRKVRKGQACRRFGAEKREPDSMVGTLKKTARALVPGPV